VSERKTKEEKQLTTQRRSLEIFFFSDLLGDNESFCESAFALEFNLDAPERANGQITDGAVQSQSVLVRAKWLVIACAKIKLTATSRFVCVVAHCSAN
jgi:hypothetical protein